MKKTLHSYIFRKKIQALLYEIVLINVFWNLLPVELRDLINRMAVKY